MKSIDIYNKIFDAMPQEEGGTGEWLESKHTGILSYQILTVEEGVEINMGDSDISVLTVECSNDTTSHFGICGVDHIDSTIKTLLINNQFEDGYSNNVRSLNAKLEDGEVKEIFLILVDVLPEGGFSQRSVVIEDANILGNRSITYRSTINNQSDRSLPGETNFVYIFRDKIAEMVSKGGVNTSEDLLNLVKSLIEIDQNSDSEPDIDTIISTILTVVSVFNQQFEALFDQPHINNSENEARLRQKSVLLADVTNLVGRLLEVII